MSQVKADARHPIKAPADQVFAALADYTGTRPTILPENYRDYEVLAGGTGAGTTVRWKLAATKKRVRDCLVEVSEPRERTLVERDTNSTMITTWNVAPDGDGSSVVTAHTTWQGAGGIAGFFEGVFAPLGLRKIHGRLLANLDRVVTGS